MQLSELSCPHRDAPVTRRVCSHLLENKDWNFFVFYTGIQFEYALVCPACSDLTQGGNISLQTICETCFKKIEDEGCRYGVIGRPEVIYKPGGLAFTHHEVQMANLFANDLIDIQPLPNLLKSAWIALKNDGTVIKIDLEDRLVSEITKIPASVLDIKEPISIHISPDGRFAALVQIIGTEGMVIDLETGKITMQLKRDKDCCDISPFPIAYFTYQGKQLLIHSTFRNRLDISDPNTGELLTLRDLPLYDPKEEPPHYLDYFHARLLVSPDHEWVVDDGWVWHPFGVIRSWNLRRWMEENVWESEDGISVRELIWRAYFWGGPFCWIGDHLLAVWGFGDDDDWIIPAVMIFDVTSGEQLRWFAGPEVAPRNSKTWEEKMADYGGFLIFDDYLFSCSEKYGTAIWDVNDGACLHQDSSFFPRRYHPEAKEFLTLLPNGNFRLTRLVHPVN